MNFNMTLLEWLENHHNKITFDKVSWMGVPFHKNVLDAWIYQELIFKIKPDVIVEIGSENGGSTIYFAHLLDCIGKGMVISVDIDRKAYKAKHDRITTITGHSSAEWVIEEVHRHCKDKIVLINQDGGHSEDQVFRDLTNYSDLVSIGSYFIVEDSLLDLCNEPLRAGISKGPLMAINKFLETNHNFTIDLECERYILTANPSGYLKRIR
jgi:cephalosporin hydroxylase